MKNGSESFQNVLTQDTCNSASCKKKKRRNTNIVHDYNDPTQVFTSEMENNLTDLFCKPIVDTPKLASAKWYSTLPIISSVKLCFYQESFWGSFDLFHPICFLEC